MSTTNENVKIIINEHDLTTGAGTGVSSSDIAFVPGFSCNENAPKNIPVLCTSVKEFEANFGNTPYKLTEKDIAGYESYGFIEGTYDPSYVFAKELLYQGMFVIYANLAPLTQEGELDKVTSKLNSFYKLDELKDAEWNIRNVIKQLEDRNEYSVKYLTSGGYPSIVIIEGKGNDIFAGDMIDVCATRGDAVALVDYQKTTDVTLFDIGEGDDTKSVYKDMQSIFEYSANGEFGAAMYPWAEYTCVSSLRSVETDPQKWTMHMPASFGYLMCLAKAIKTSPNWLAMAGVSRGLVPNVKGLLTKGILTNTIAEEMQPKFGEKGKQTVSVNCITNIRPYGLCIWGNRTLKPMGPDGAVALNFLNTRNMISDIKKVLYTSAKELMFEQNCDTLWIRFKSLVTPLLNQLKSGNGISDYKVIKSDTNYEGNPLQKGELAAVIRIFPLHAVEYFELNVEIRDNDVTVS